MRTVRPNCLLLVSAATLLAAGCDDSPLPQEPDVPEPVATAAGDGPSLVGPAGPAATRSRAARCWPPTI